MRRYVFIAMRLFLLWLGAFLVTISLNYGADVTLGWWGFSFWAGVGILAASWGARLDASS